MIAKKIFQRFFFVHIPKTAGTSISTVIVNSKKYRINFSPTEHATASEIINTLGKNSKKFYSFSFVRNPWDRLNSLYHFLYQKKLSAEKGENWDQQALKNRGFKAWLLEEDFWPPYLNRSGLSFQKRTQSYFLCDKEKNILVDDVFRYENLKNELTILSKNIGIGFERLPITKATLRDNYKYEYCSETIDFVNHFHKEDIERFNYKFD